MTDGGPSAVLTFGNHLCRAGGVVGFHDAQVGVLLQIVARLHEGHGVGVYLGDGLPRVVGQTADAMGDVELMLDYDGGARVAQQLVVVEQATGDGVLDGGHCNHGRVLANALVNLFKRLAAEQLQLLALEVLVGGDVVKRTDLALYGYSFHNLCLRCKISAFHLYCQTNSGNLCFVVRKMIKTFVWVWKFP